MKMAKDYKKIHEAVGELLRCERKKAGYTRAELAKLSSVSMNEIFNIEHGRVRTTTETMDMLCEPLGVDLTYILKPYGDKRFMHKNSLQSCSPKNALLGVSDSQKPQDTQEEKILKTKGLAGGVKSAKIKLAFIMLHNHLYYTKVVINVWKMNSRCLDVG